MDKYLKIWKNFNKNFKEGVVNEFEFRDQLANILLFNSSKNPKDKYTDLESYVKRMKEDHFEIYYAVGTDYEAIDKNPALEAFKNAKEILEVLLGLWVLL